MARACDTCSHPSRSAIDRRLAAGATVRSVSAEFRLSEDSVTRHRRLHLPVKVVQRQVLVEARASIDIARMMEVAAGAAVAVLAEARQSGRAELILRAVDRLLACVAVQTRITEGADAAELQERLVVLEERLAGFGGRPASTRLPGGPGWPRTAT